MVSVTSFIAVALCACTEDQDKQVGTCEVEALRLYPEQSLVEGNNVASYVEACMRAHGYGWSPAAHNNCFLGPRMHANSACYVPTVWPWDEIDRIVYQKR